MNEYLLTWHSSIPNLDGRTENVRWECNGDKYILTTMFYVIIAKKVNI